MKYIDKFLNQITMYRLTLYYLIGLVGIAVVFSFFGILSFNPFDILISTTIALFFCLIFNYVFAKMFKAVTNVESVFITALILVLIIPVKFPLNATFFMLASALAMGAKYVVTIEKRHIFNPAAVAVAAVALLSSDHAATWWVGTPAMLPFVLIGGLLLMRKIQRERLILVFLLTYFIMIIFPAWYRHEAILFTLKQSTFQSALFFFAFVMLTEPLTSPSTKKLQSYYAIITAILFATPQLRLFNFALTPELALCIGNIFSYVVSPKYRLELVLKEKIAVSKTTYIFTFEHVDNVNFIPGQYMEWTLPHTHADSRGNRRYFSLASSQQEENIMLMVKFYDNPSSYKKTLMKLKPGEKIIAADLAGDFVLPKDTSKPLVFIAGGVGIAPFRSMIQHIVENNLQVNIVLLYANRYAEDIAFAELFEKAKKNGVQTLYVLTSKEAVPHNWQGLVGHVDEATITQTIPDYMTRLFYLSGPQLMTQSFIDVLHKAGVHEKNIKHDFFPGYAEM